MGFTLSFKHEKESTTAIEMSYGYNAYRDVFDPELFKGKTGAEMVDVLKRAIQILEAKHPIRTSTRNLLKPSSGNFEVILRTLLDDASTHAEWIFNVD